VLDCIVKLESFAWQDLLGFWFFVEEYCTLTTPSTTMLGLVRPCSGGPFRANFHFCVPYTM
jgi:hypothetical protein